MDRVGDDARAASAGLAPGSRWRPAALQLEGLSLLLSGDPDGADPVFARVAALGEDIGNHPAVATGLAERAVIAIGRQEWGEADHLAARSAAVVRAGDLEDYAQSGLPYAVSARTAVHRATWWRPVCTWRPSPGCGRCSTTRCRTTRSRRSSSWRGPTWRWPTAPAPARCCGRCATSCSSGPTSAPSSRRRPTCGSASTRWRPGPSAASSLTTAELRLVPFLSTHLTFPQIGERLFVSRHTVKTQAVSIYRKLGVTSRGEAIERVEALGLLGR